MLREGATVAEIAQSRSLKESTLFGHCAEAISLGLLQAHEVLPLTPAELDAIRTALLAQADNGEIRLKPVYEAFAERYDYGLLRCVAAGLEQTPKH